MSQAIRTHVVDHCSVCGSRSETAYEHLTDDVYGVSGDWGFRRCTAPECQSWWLDPMPLDEDIPKLYATYYTHRKGAPGNASPSLRKKAASKALDKLNQLLWRHSPPHRHKYYVCLDDMPPGRVLEVGCGNGELLMRLQEIGWQVEGQDFDPNAVDNAASKGITVYNEPVEELANRGKEYDAIFLSHVIEHLPHPVEMLRVLRTMLAPNGRLVVITPNCNSYGHHAFGRHWVGLDVPRHMFLFSPKSLSAVAVKAGFPNPDTSVKLSNLRFTFTKGVERTGESLVFHGLNCLGQWALGKEIGEEIVLVAGRSD